MTELPFDDAYFDGAYATESLEHAVEIERAVGEICRVVKPGGRIAIIDKNSEHWGKLHTPEWEQWFTRKELERLLRKDCRQVSSPGPSLIGKMWSRRDVSGVVGCQVKNRHMGNRFYYFQ